MATFTPALQLKIRQSASLNIRKQIVKEYLSKGRQVYVEGRIDNRSYDDKEGNKRYVSEIVAQRVQFLGSRGDASGEPAPAAETPSAVHCPAGRHKNVRRPPDH